MKILLKMMRWTLKCLRNLDSWMSMVISFAKVCIDYQRLLMYIKSFSSAKKIRCGKFVLYLGKTGDWKNHFSPELDKRVEEWMENNLNHSNLKFITELQFQEWWNLFIDQVKFFSRFCFIFLRLRTVLCHFPQVFF